MLPCYCRKINSLLLDGLDGSNRFIFRGRFLTFLWHKNVHSTYYLIGDYKCKNGELSTHYRAIVRHARVFQRHCLYNELTLPSQSKQWWFCWWYRFIQQNKLNKVTSECSGHNMFHLYDQWTWGNVFSHHLEVQSTWFFHWAHQHWHQMWGETPRRSFEGLPQPSELQNARPSGGGGSDWFGHWFCISGNQAHQYTEYWFWTQRKGIKYQLWPHTELISCRQKILNYNKWSFWALRLRILWSASYKLSYVTV